MLYPESIAEIRADGIGDIMLTASIVKLALYQIRPNAPDELKLDPADRVEARQVVGIVSMSIPQLVEGLVNVLGTVVSNLPALDQARADETNRMLNAIKNWKFETAGDSSGQSRTPLPANEPAD